MTAQLPGIDLQGFDRLRFSYDQADDIAHLHINAPRPSVAEEVDDGWYLFIDDSGAREVVTMLEIHGFHAGVWDQPYFDGVVRPSLDEVKRSTGKGFEDGFEAEGSIEEFPRTARLLTFLLGVAITKLEALNRRERAEAVK